MVENKSKMSGTKKAVIGTAVAGAIAAGGWALNLKFKLFDSFDMSQKNTTQTHKNEQGKYSFQAGGGAVTITEDNDETTTTNMSDQKVNSSSKNDEAR